MFPWRGPPKRLLLPDAELMLLAMVAMEIKEFEEAPEDEDDNEEEEDRDEDGFPFLIGDCDKKTGFFELGVSTKGL